VKYRLLGSSGLRVSELCLGTSTFGEESGWGASREQSARIFEAFAEAGGNFIDTSPNDTNGTAERYIGDFIGTDRERFVLGTKYSLTTRPDHPNGGGNHRKNMVQSLKGSLQRLATGYVDLYWVHMWDFMTPVDEVMRALDDLVRAGTVLHVGISDTPAWIVAHANTLAQLRGWTPFVSLQVRYSLLDRTIEREYLPMAQAFDLAVTAWSPLGGGILTGKYNHSPRPSPEEARLALPEMAGALDDRGLAIADAVGKIALECGRTPSQVALRWIRQRPGVIIPLIGARRESQIRENLGCLDFDLPSEQIAELDALTQIEPGFPYDFLGGEKAEQYVNGECFRLVENHRAAHAGRPY
jgi:aryl-alcohol dehydrogenase-like predicted oxidoreductase